MGMGFLFNIYFWFLVLIMFFYFCGGIILENGDYVNEVNKGVIGGDDIYGIL